MLPLVPFVFFICHRSLAQTRSSSLTLPAHVDIQHIHGFHRVGTSQLFRDAMMHGVHRPPPEAHTGGRRDASSVRPPPSQAASRSRSRSPAGGLKLTPRRASGGTRGRSPPGAGGSTRGSHHRPPPGAHDDHHGSRSGHRSPPGANEVHHGSRGGHRSLPGTGTAALRAVYARLAHMLC